MRTNQDKICAGIVWALLLLTSLLCFETSAAEFPNPKERIDYWRDNFRELGARQDARVDKAQAVFNRVLQAAGNRHGVHPRLHILAQDPLNISLPISIPDGWIIISKSVLDICYNEKAGAQDRLAFILSHEIAHLLDDDFWHINFFNAVDSSKKRGTSDPSILNDLITIVGSADKIAAKELRADEHGILFTSMAGFNVDAIIGAKQQQSFFQQWESLLDINRINQHELNANVHPTANQRTAAVLARLQQIADQAELFQLGLLFYQSGKFELAVNTFSEFLRYYPGREVHHNLAASYHQLALMHYPPQDIVNNKGLVFKTSIAVDPYTRASHSVFRGSDANENLFKENIDSAIAYYQAAIKQDPDYLLAYKNLGSAYVLNDEPFKAIALLKDALTIAPQDAEALNVLGVAFYLAENSKKAIGYLQEAHQYNVDYSDPLYNLGKIAQLEDRHEDAKNYWAAYLKLDPASYWANLIQGQYQLASKQRQQHGLVTTASEKLLELQVGNYADEVPPVWGKPAKRLFPLQETPYVSVIYQNGITAIEEGDEIRMLVANPRFAGQSNRGIAIGAQVPTVVKAYGQPSLELDTTQGKSLVYVEEGITFQVRDNKVVSWVIY